MFVEEPLVPTSSNDILASLSFLHPEKGRRHCFPLMPRRERALTWTFRPGLYSWGDKRSLLGREKRTRRVMKISVKTEGEMRSSDRILSMLGFPCKNPPPSEGACPHITLPGWGPVPNVWVSQLASQNSQPYRMLKLCLCRVTPGGTHPSCSELCECTTGDLVPTSLTVSRS